LIADWNVVKQEHLKEVTNLEKEMKDVQNETKNAKDRADVLEEKNKLLQQEKGHLQNVINDKDKVNVSLLDQLNGLEGIQKEHEAMTQKISEQSLLLKRERTRTCSVRKQRKLDVKEAITDTERRVQNEMFATVSKQQEEIKSLYETIESVRSKKNAEIEKVRNERDMKVKELQKDMKDAVESIRSEKDAEIERVQKDAELRLKSLQKEIESLNGTIEVLRSGEK
jgi:chromosome segregation ATPase